MGKRLLTANLQIHRTSRHTSLNNIFEVVRRKGKSNVTATDFSQPPCPTPPPPRIQFGPVRSARSVFASSTEHPRKPLILFDFSAIVGTIATTGSVCGSA
jgi:hypothetical protein